MNRNALGQFTARESRDVARLSEEVRVERDNNGLLTERLAELELALEDHGWMRMLSDFQRDFSRDSLNRLIRLSRIMYLKNPLINRGCNIQAVYVWAQGVTFTAADPDAQAIVDEFVADPKNKAELTSHQARTLKEIDLQVTGNLFLVFFSSPDGVTRLRSIPPEEVMEIVCNPEDAKEPWYYKRQLMRRDVNFGTGALISTSQISYYPDLHYYNSDPVDKPVKIGQYDVLWDTPVYHVKVGSTSDMLYGTPETYQALDWARAATKYLEDFASVVRAYSRFAWNLTVQGGQTAIAQAKTKLGTTVSGGSAARLETNPPPLTAGTFVGTSGTKMEPIRTSGATAAPEDVRRFVLMVAAAFGYPETFFGDASVGALATAQSLDRPTELKFLDRQQLYQDIHQTIFAFAIARKKGAQRVRDTVDAVVNTIFPPILERDITKTVDAIVNAATLAGHPPANSMPSETVSRLLLQALGVPDVEELLDTLTPMQKADPAVAEALRGITVALDRLQETK
jgi:hypothetical protein